MTARPAKRYAPFQSNADAVSGKTALRLWATQQIAGSTLHIADLFAGDGDIWGAVKKMTRKRLSMFRNDITAGRRILRRQSGGNCRRGAQPRYC